MPNEVGKCKLINFTTKIDPRVICEKVKPWLTTQPLFDGQNSCSRCKSSAVECKYETPLRQSKDELRTKIEQLHQRLGTRSRVISALAQPKLSSNILTRLWVGDSVETIYEGINSSNVDNQLGGLGLQGSWAFHLQNKLHGYNLSNVGARDWEGHAAAMSSPADVMSTPNVMLQTTAQGGQSSRERNSVLWPLGRGGNDRICRVMDDGYPRYRSDTAFASIVPLLGISHICIAEQGAPSQRFP